MPGQLRAGDREFRHRIFRHFAETGSAPPRVQLAAWAGSEESASQSLTRLHDAHALVLASDGTIRMALPFSATPTDHVVRSGNLSWFANCAWDALAIPVAIGGDAHIASVWLDDGSPVTLSVTGTELSSYEGYVHFGVAAAHWWDDIVET